MALIGDVVIYIIMGFVVWGAIAAMRNDREGMGKEFLTGLHSIGPIFIPVAGIMASIPYLSWFVERVLGPVWDSVGADPGVAATTFIASDMGGYQLALATAGSNGAGIIALVTGFMAGATIVFTIPVGLAMLDRRDHKYMALGIMSGVLTIPVGVFIAMSLVLASGSTIRAEAETSGATNVPIEGLSMGSLLVNLVPVTIVVVLIALGLRLVPDLMIRIFLVFGRVLDIAIKLVLAFSIVEYFTGFFTWLFGSWGFDPIIADAEDQFRALEVAGYIGIMLAGAFPMVYALRTYLKRPISAVGDRVGLSTEGTAGVLAAAANVLALFHLIRTMPAKDKVMCIAFAVCSAFLLGDHLSFTANFQPTLIGPVLIGKLTAGVLAMVLAYWIAVPVARRLEAQDADEDADEAAADRTPDPAQTT